MGTVKKQCSLIGRVKIQDDSLTKKNKVVGNETDIVIIFAIHKSIQIHTSSDILLTISLKDVHFKQTLVMKLFLLSVR